MDKGEEGKGKKAEDIVKRVLEKTFEEMGARPETLILPNILLQKGGKLEGLYVIPGYPQLFFSEKEAEGVCQGSKPIFRVDVTRIN